MRGRLLAQRSGRRMRGIVADPTGNREQRRAAQRLRVIPSAGVNGVQSNATRHTKARKKAADNG